MMDVSLASHNIRDKRDFENHPVPHLTNKGILALKGYFSKVIPTRVPVPGPECASPNNLSDTLDPLLRCLS